MTRNYTKLFRRYVRLLENGKSLTLLQDLLSKKRWLIEDELKVLRSWLRNKEQSSRNFIQSNIVRFENTVENVADKKLKQVINFLEGYLILPSDHVLYSSGLDEFNFIPKRHLQE